MPCKSCGSVNQSKFTAEMAIHFPGLQNIDKPVVWVFPELVVCLDCGTAQFAVPEAELRQLAKGYAAAAGWLRIESSYFTKDKRLSVPRRCFGKRSCLPLRESCSMDMRTGYFLRAFWLDRFRVVRTE